MAGERRSRLGRRGLLGLAASSGAAFALKAGAARASSGEPVLAGEVNIANRETVLSSSSPDKSTLRVSTGSQIAVIATHGDAIDFGQVDAAIVGVSSKGSGVIAAALRQVGPALEVRGRVAFASAGFADIPKSAASWTVYDVYVPGGSMIVGQLQGYAGPQVEVRYCVRVDDTSFRVQLSNVTTMNARVAYFIFEPAVVLPGDTIRENS